MSDLDTRLRQALHDLAPQDPTTEGLADGAHRYATRARRIRQLGVATATAATLVLATVLVAASYDPPSRVVPAGPFLTPADCTLYGDGFSPPPAEGQVPADALAAWVCPDPTPAQPTVATLDGWSLPTQQVTGRRVATLNLGGRVDESSCRTVHPGPAFTVTVRSARGGLSTVRSGELACGGAHALAAFFRALAGEEADARAQSASSPAYACRTDEEWLNARRPRSLTNELHSPLVAATFCLLPNFLAGDPAVPIQPLTARSVRSIKLPAAPLALLNADLTSDWGGFFTGNGACSGEGSWTYSIVGVTAAGDERMLGTSCLDELWVTGASRTGFIPSVRTTAALRALVPPR